MNRHELLTFSYPVRLVPLVARQAWYAPPSLQSQMWNSWIGDWDVSVQLEYVRDD